MAEEKIITINLRRKIVKVPRWRRSRDGIKILRKILERRVKGKVSIDKKLNEEFWKRSSQKPPTKLRIKVSKVEEGKFKAELLK